MSAFILAAVVLAWIPTVRAAPTETATVRLRSQVTIGTPKLVLGDIAEVSGASRDFVDRLAGMPLGLVSDVRLIKRSEVLSLVRTTFSDPDGVTVAGAESARVSVAVRSVKVSEIEPLVRKFLAAVTQWRQQEIEVRSISGLQGAEIPERGVELRIASRGAPSSLRGAMLLMEAVTDGILLRSFWIKADVRVRARVVRVAQPVAYRACLKVADLSEVVADIDDPRTSYVRTIDEVVGMTAKRSLVPGDLLNRAWLEEVDLVRSGETVQLLAQTGSIMVRTTALALENGKLGERIRVRNIDSNRILLVVVMGQGEVRVDN